MLGSYHNHTTWSDGQATVGQTLEAAGVLGMDEVGISDHLTLHPSGRDPHWAMPRHRLDDYVADLLKHRDLARARGGPGLRLGVETDWFASAEAEIRSALAGHPWDYVIGSVHTVGDFTVDSSAEAWERMTQQERGSVHQGYWRQIALMAASGMFDIVGHIDVIKKLGFACRADISGLIGEAVDAIAASGMVVELNTSGWHKPCREAYPSHGLLRQCRDRDIPIMVNADAHRPDHLLRSFPQAVARLADVGYRQVVRFADRQMHTQPLEDLVRLGTPIDQPTGSSIQEQ